MATEIVMALVGVLCTAISSTVTFILTKRRYNVEVDSQQIKNMSDSFDTYKKMMEETLEAQKRATDATISSLNDRIASLQKENDNLRNQFNQLQGQMINLLMGNKLAGFQDIMTLKQTLAAESKPTEEK